MGSSSTVCASAAPDTSSVLWDSEFSGIISGAGFDVVNGDGFDAENSADFDAYLSGFSFIPLTAAGSSGSPDSCIGSAIRDFAV